MNRNLCMMSATVLTLSALAAHAQAPSGLSISQANRTIAITATDSVTRMADVANLHIGYVAYGADHDAAYSAGSATSNAIVNALKSAGVASDAIESDEQDLSEVQPFQLNQFSESERPNHKWRLTQSWTVRTNPDRAASLLDVAVKAGANQGGQIEWALRDDDAAQADAAAKALQRARSIAETMAHGLNVNLGKLIYASNEATASPIRPVMMGFAGMAKAAPQPLAINPRRIQKSATVYAVFAIE